MLYLSKLPFVGHNDGTREEVISWLAENFVGIGCEIRDANVGRYIIGNPFLSFKPLGRLSFLSTIDKIELNVLENSIGLKIVSTYRVVFLTIVALAIGYNIVDRLYYNATDAMKIGLTAFIAIILVMMIFYVNALRAKSFARRALKSG